MNAAPPTDAGGRCPLSARVAEYYAGTLDDARCRELEQHLEECDACAQAADTLTDASDATIRALSSLTAVDDDEPEFQRLEATLLGTPATAVGWPRAGRPADPPVGALPCQFGNYELQRCIGRGAWGAVYHARHTRLDLPIAVKVLDPGRLPDAEAAEQFLREAKAAGQLRHPGIVRATDAGQHNGLYYLAMDLIEGVDAGRLAGEGPLRVADACEVVRQAAEALDHAHALGWVHRDVKPSNLIVDHEGHVRLLDLGIAGRHDAPPAAAPPVRPLGTAEYMAPEQWTDFDRVDGRADVYSLGCTLWRLLVGRPPVPGGGSLRRERPDASRRLERLVAQMLTREVALRVGSAAEVAKRLRGPARTANLAALVAAESLSQDGKDSRTTSVVQERAGVSRRRFAAAAAAGIGGIGIGAWSNGAWLFAKSEQRLRRSHWRPLQPTDGLWLSFGAAEEVEHKQLADGTLRLDAAELALLSLGHAVAAPLGVRVRIRQNEWLGASGVFFAGRQLADGGVESFQLIELRPPDNPKDLSARRLLWSAWSVGSDGGPPTRTPLAETLVRLDRAAGDQLLEVTIGAGAFPAVRWNGGLAPEEAWTLSAEGQRRAARGPRGAAAACVGRIGVAAAGGESVFLQPEMTYLRVS
ncbi:Serine/threonine-protein kinase PrkC [Posidoniimonas polymericola]|uniref:Serine/threonine-protein kinase PrkC n=1 Tax=Posidoniimonas polymericola TaxID=2528002 RepID=A0A5C5YMD7_9BACT|nr:protein kinase [Posidoniimonas polymericola]TWT76072.1 Serine/threonine-protein kinase PrkC [Posidoniimonas polymericola]